MVTLSLLLIISVALNWIIYENNNYEKEFQNVENELIDFQKKLIKKEVDRTADYIEYVLSIAENQMMDNLQHRVEIAYNIAESIYIKYHGRIPDDEVQELIISALRPFRFNSPDDHVFIYTLDGVAVLIPNNPQEEGLSRINVIDQYGKAVVQSEVNLMKEVDKGFIKYHVPVGDNNKDSLLVKTSYIKKFKHFNWYLGSKDYLSNFEEKIKDELLSSLANIDKEDDSYIFINNTDGEQLLLNGIRNDKISSPISAKDKATMDQMTKVAIDGTGYLSYLYQRPGLTGREPKISYVKLINKWGWIVGTGFYTKSVDKEIAQKRSELKAQQKLVTTRVLGSLVLILIIGILFIRQIIKSINKGFERFDRFFAETAESSVRINEKELYFKEFKLLSRSANKMLVDLEQTRSAFIKEKSLLKSLIDSIPDFVFFKDPQSNYVGCNLAYAKYMSMSEEELIGKNDYDLYSKQEAEIYNASDKKVIKDHIAVRNEEWINVSGLGKRLFDTVKVVYCDSNGDVLGIVGVSRDITEREVIQQKYIAAKEKAEEADRLKTAFLANMSHEIRTPMNSIVGFSNLIAEGDLSENERQEYVGHINLAVDNLLNLINDIIDIAKIEAGQLTIKHEYFDVHKLLEDVFISNLETRKKLNNNNVKLLCTKDQTIKQTNILADPYRLIQVLNNLIGNATKFTNQGEIEFGYELKNNELEFFVRDTGIGIAPEDQHLVFKRFRQVGENSGYKKAGTGLGLAISKHIVQLMGGKIWVVSEKGKGSIFHFTIPYYPLQNVISGKGILKNYNWDDKTIMIIEKEDISFNYLKAVFSNTGTKLIRAFNYKEAIGQLKDCSQVNLIYGDVINGDKHIEDFISNVKITKPETPLILQIDHSDELNKYQKRCDTIITKPVKYHMLVQVIANYMQN